MYLMQHGKEGRRKKEEGRGKENHYLINSVTICTHTPVCLAQLATHGNQDPDQKQCFEVLLYH